MSEPVEAFAELPRERTAENALGWTLEYLGHLLGLPPSQIDVAQSVTGHALDSVDAVVMASAMEEHFRIEIDPGLFLRDAPLGKVIAGLCAEAAWSEK